MLTTLLVVIFSAPLPPQDIVPRMLARIKNDTTNSQSLVYTQERAEYEIRDGTDHLKKLESRAVRGTGTGFLKRLISRNRAPIVNADEEPLDTSMIRLVPKYHFVPVNVQAVSVDGYDCWQIRFTPIDGLEDGSDDDAILNHMEGVVYVDSHNYLVRSIHATLSTPFRRGFLGAARIVSAMVDTRQIEWDDRKHVGIQTSTVIRIRYTMMGDTDLRIEYLNTNHRWQP